jgi:hypothetical protein
MFQLMLRLAVFLYIVLFVMILRKGYEEVAETIIFLFVRDTFLLPQILRPGAPCWHHAPHP